MLIATNVKNMADRIENQILEKLNMMEFENI